MSGKKPMGLHDEHNPENRCFPPASDQRRWRSRAARWAYGWLGELSFAGDTAARAVHWIKAVGRAGHLDDVVQAAVYERTRALYAELHDARGWKTAAQQARAEVDVINAAFAEYRRGARAEADALNQKFTEYRRTHP